jgi:hypothetical protein
MAYRDFKIIDLEKKFGIKCRQITFLPENIQPVQPSAWLIQTLEMKRKSKPNTTEKAVSESIIDPILTEVTVNNAEKITLFSGENLKADPSKGLNGEVDFMMVHCKEALELVEPVINITEAKLNQALEKSLAQAGAQMIGARLFNKNNGQITDTIYGSVTNGRNWIFLKLEGDTLFIANEKDYATAQLPMILGIFQWIINNYS